MEDIVTKSFLDDFSKSYEFSRLSESDVFELFSIYCIASKYVKNELITRDLLQELNVGKGGDWGMDGVMLIVNGRPILNKTTLDDIYNMIGTIEVKIIVVQAKISPSFDVSKLSLTLDGIKNLLRDIQGETHLPPCNDALKDLRRLLKYIYSMSADFKDGKNPTIDAYYVTCGQYKEQADFTSKINMEKSFYLGTGLIDNFSCELLGKKEIVELYKNTKMRKEVDINVEQKIPLPKVPKIDDGYICLLPFRELKKLYIDSSGQLINEVFYDNVRAYQGENIVNKAMKESIERGNIDLFAAMNNGITIIARRMTSTGYNIHLFDYQIVNGCQTCNVLFRCIDMPNIDDLKISVKLIASTDKEVQDKIIIANNSQTEVKREQLVSLLPIQKSIEDYYNAMNKYEQLYYERRSKQYINEKSVPAYKVITISNQIKAFVSMIMGEPDKVRGYYGSIVSEFDKNGKRVFDKETHPALYYTSALALYKVEDAFFRGQINKKYKKVKFHFLLALRLMCEDRELPRLNSKDIVDYCDHLCEIFCDSNKFSEALNAAIGLIDYTLKRNPVDSDQSSEKFTQQMNVNIKEVIKRKKELYVQ